MEHSDNQQLFASDLVAALNGLVKLTRSLSFYPADHPSLAGIAEDACASVAKLLEQHGPRPVEITAAGFLLDGDPLTPEDKGLNTLAARLSEHQAQHLLILSTLEKYELLIFAEEICRSAEEIVAAGGLANRLVKRHVRSIWINETDIDLILVKLREMGLEPPALMQRAPRPYPEQTNHKKQHASIDRHQATINRMRELLEHLKEPQEDVTYLQILDQVQQFSGPFFSETGLPGRLAVLGLLDSQRRDGNHSQDQRQAAGRLLEELLTEVTSKTLTDAVAEQTLKPSQRRALTRLLINLGPGIAPPLLKRLYAERDAIVRRHYSGILAQMGESIFGLLKVDLKSTTWHVVRNVVTILGETRSEAALPLLSQAIDHPEARVRRAVIRALGAIGGNRVIPLLLKLTKDENKDLHHPAIMALGSLKSSQVIAPLTRIMKESDLRGRKTRLKLEAIQALAATRSPQAIIPLLKLARRGNLMNRGSVEVLRAEAILALAQLGNAQLVPVLEQLPKSDKGPVSRALKQAKAQLLKQSPA